MKPFVHRGHLNRRHRKAEKLWNRHRRYQILGIYRDGRLVEDRTAADGSDLRLPVTIQVTPEAKDFRLYRDRGAFPDPRRPAPKNRRELDRNFDAWLYRVRAVLASELTPEAS